MSETPQNKNTRSNRKKITEQPKPKIECEKNFSNESEIIVKFIIEKIISLSMTETLINNVNKLMPEYCYNQIYETLNIIMQLDNISYEKDDYPFKIKNSLKKMKSFKNINNKLTLPLPTEEDELFNSEEIRKYKFENEYDINISSEIDIKIALLENQEKNKDEKEKEKENNKEIIFEGILKREGYDDINNSFQNEKMIKENKIKKYNKKSNYNFREDKLKIINEIYSSVSIPGINNENENEKEKEKEPFKINPEEKIEAIQNVETHKLVIDTIQSISKNKNNNLDKKISIPFEAVIESKNNWKPISQPISAPIDRDATTKIKYEKPLFSKSSKNINLNNIKEEQPQNNNDININENRKPTLRRTKYFNTLNNAQEKGKKKKLVELPFDSIDIEPNKLIAYKELEDIASLREKTEKEIQEKKKEKELLLKIEKEKKAKLEQFEEQRKELNRKKVTVDANGNIVFIKPLDIKNLIEEFNKGKTLFKNIKTVEAEVKYDKDKENIKVEKNPEVLWNDIKEEKNKKNRKKKIHFQKNGLLNNNNSSADLKQKKFEKGVKFASGSNFAIFNPEIGVNITENKKEKSGGKDFYKKYNRFSLEVFQEQLSKTSKNFFPKISEQNDMINQINENDSVQNKSKRKKSYKFSNTNLDKILEYKSKKNNNLLTLNNKKEKNSISLKTGNLKMALQDLDLITEREMNKLNKTKKINKTIFLKKILNKSNSTQKKNYNDMDKFAKTLVGKEKWEIGTYTERENYNNYKIPKKPENIEIKRELPKNMLKHMPRKRLPPINNMFRLNTMTGFFTNRNNKKIIKEKNSEKKENIDSK